MCIRANLGQEEQGVLQLLLALLPLLLARKQSVRLLIVQEAVEEVFVLEAQLLVHCVTMIASALNHKAFKRAQAEAPRRVSPWLRTPSSSSTCHMPTACRRERTQELCCISQSTSSVPTQHCLGDTPGPGQGPGPGLSYDSSRLTSHSQQCKYVSFIYSSHKPSVMSSDHVLNSTK